MKTKTNFIIKTFALIISFTLAAFGIAAIVSNIKNTEVQAVEANFTATDDYTGVDENHYVFQIEKVGVIANGDNSDADYSSSSVDTTDYTTTLYSDASGTELSTYMISSNYQTLQDGTSSYRSYYKYYYQKIANGTSSSYVVRDGEFVMLNNNYNNGTYSNSSITTTYDADGNPVTMQEAIMISFGQFVYDENTGTYNIATDDTGANINMVSQVSVTLNGKSVSVPLRSYSTYADFAMIIPQTEGNEGYWTITLTYYNTAGTEYTATFSFYLIFNTSYIGSVQDSDGNTYEVSPNIKLNGNELSQSNSVYQYSLGDSDSYPVLTYDYTKYSLSYTLTANGDTTTYTYSVNYYSTGTAGNYTQHAQLVCTMTGAQTGTVTYDLDNYDSSRTNNLVSIVLSDVGEYVFSFEYIYSGYNSDEAPEMNLTISQQQLKISGVEITYYNSGTQAQMRYVTFANNSDNKYIDLIIPSGYELDTTAVEGYIMYDIDTTSTSRVGTVVASQGGNYNVSLASYITSNLNSITTVNGLATAFLDYKTETNTGNDEYIQALLEYMASNSVYTRTNQGPINFSSNDDYDWTNSFYFYSSSPITSVENLSSAYNDYTQQTSFDSVGYYILFIKISGGDYIVFAFQYNTDTGNVSITTSETNYTLAADDYTNEDIVISWAKRGVFERQVTVSYSYSQNKSSFINTVDITTAAKLKDDGYYYYTISLESGTYMHYKITINIDGKSSTSTIVTIDKEDISGIYVYEVRQTSNELGNTIYLYDTDDDGNYISIEEAITNSLAGITWADKASGAEISVTYTITEIVSSSVSTYELENGQYVLYVTPYTLGSTSSVNYDITSNDTVNVLSKQGLYLFTFTDAAGNSCYYLFIIDKTDNYFKVTDITSGESVYSTASFLTYSNDVTITVGTHKAISLGELSSDDSTLNSILTTAGGSSANYNNFATIGYYTGTGSNWSTLSSLFATINSSGSYITYLTVENSTLSAYNDMNVADSSLSISSISNSNHSVSMVYDDDSNSTSMIRTFYLTGVNNKLSESAGGSYITVEINKDSSRGMVYYTNNQSYITTDNIIAAGKDINSSNLSRLVTGTNIDGAHATSDNYIVFTWYAGSGATEVGEVYYTYYTLGSSYSSSNAYYSTSGTEVVLYSNNSYQNGATTFTDNEYNTRAYALINLSNGSTADGLYVITRTYANGNIRDNEGNVIESATLNYWFIVDRNSIIDSGVLFGDSYLGQYISIGLMDEVTYNSFSSYNVSTGTLNYTDNETSLTTTYSIYLSNSSATKLPATLNIPISKYFNGTDVSNYYAGRLQIALYFVDTNNQLSQFSQSSQGSEYTFKLFEITTSTSNFTTIGDNGELYYTIDITQQLSSQYKNYFLTTTGNTSWLTLPGDYVIVITDTVEGSTSSHQKVIGFRINGNESLVPSTDIYSSDVSTSSSSEVNLSNFASYSDGAYYLTTNDEYIIIDLPAYDEDSTTAMVDADNLQITYTLNGTRYTFTVTNGDVTDSDTNISYTKNTDGSARVVITTYLRDSNGNILTNYATSISYEITLYYKYSDSSAYYYYKDGVRQYYYSSTTYVTIDRTPPQENITALQDEEFLSYYTSESLFETVYQDNGESGVIYVTRYKNYYSTNNATDIYAFKVDSTTEFDATDVSTIYVKQITDLSNVSLADLYTGGYNIGYNIYSATGIDNYGEILTSGAGYYEIVEMDAAGNLTQYVVYYDGGEDANTDVQLSIIGNWLSNGSITDNTTTNLGANGVTSGSSLTIYSFDSATISINGNTITSTATYTYDSYYRFEIVDRYTNTVVNYLNTSMGSNFSDIATQIVGMFTSAGYGNYIFNIYTRNTSYSYYINYYETYTLSVENLVQEVSGTYYLVLNGANETYNGAYYYATEVTYRNTNTGATVTFTSTDGNTYYNTDGSTVTLYQQLSGSYIITMTDSSGKEYTYRFSTEDVIYYAISFGEDGTSNAYTSNNVYYTFDVTKITYSTTYYNARISYSINNGTQQIDYINGADVINDYISVTVDGEYVYITISPYFVNEAGGIISATVTLYNENEADSFTYNIVIDTRFSIATLIDSEAKETAMSFDYNVDWTTTSSSTISTGTRYLSWATDNENEIFTFTYTLYEELESGEYNITEFTNTYSTTVQPSVNSAGTFRFVIEVYSPNDEYMGNVVYTFYLQATSNDLYTVTVNNAVVEANSTITLSELETLGINDYDIYTEWGVSDSELPSTSLKISLYVYNSNIDVITEEDATSAYYQYSSDYYTFRLYRISLGNDVRYLATLQMNQNATLINTIYINESIYNVNGQTLVGDDSYELQFYRVIDSTDVLYLKNTLKMDIYYYNEYVTTVTFDGSDSYLTYTLLASGQYNIRFRDLSGNIAELTFNNNEVSEELSVLILREVAVSVNGLAPIDNGYYNDSVVISILNTNEYASSSAITVTYARNSGTQTEITSTDFTYTFTQAGWYRVIITAVIGDATITRTLEFTIVNPNEAFTLFGFNNSAIEIVQVLNSSGVDVTETFLSILQSNSYTISYDQVLENASSLGITYGKQQFTVTYLVSDAIYPDREVTFSFTLNDEEPTIESSISAGNSTTKGFTITFNPGEIYRQVGDSTLYIYFNSIGGEVAYALSITEDSASEITTYTLTRQSDDYDGNYYIVLESASGRIISSFMVTITEPLNTFAIIVIVVVTAIVLAIVITIIVLRKRMRIR